ncbi:MAG: tRNA (adenosine(37)-N6)-threonylcarbamoyltransferase complex ATPase subunit type 1 TsaE [Candidatus Moraniibacteriota bacterium]|nr:MAG: tRNA (adenosine(37)-N6)-threonylcarbamoyltransferase complex ATPase subunit type 1 TsaE [Candidatus Moranbacteria bacterium]
MTETHTTQSTEETRALGKTLAGTILPGTLLCLTGELGAGKTTLVQGLLEGLGAERPYVSPTFVIMKQYELFVSSVTGVKRIYHADAYRVGSKDFTEIGFTEWCADRDGLVILEWPERIADILPEKRIDITLTSLSETEREIRIN